MTARSWCVGRGRQTRAQDLSWYGSASLRIGRMLSCCSSSKRLAVTSWWLYFVVHQYISVSSKEEPDNRLQESKVKKILKRPSC